MICCIKQTRCTLVGILLAGLVTGACTLDPNRLPSQLSPRATNDRKHKYQKSPNGRLQPEDSDDSKKEQGSDEYRACRGTELTAALTANHDHSAWAVHPDLP